MSWVYRISANVEGKEMVFEAIGSPEYGVGPELFHERLQSDARVLGVPVKLTMRSPAGGPEHLVSVALPQIEHPELVAAHRADLLAEDPKGTHVRQAMEKLGIPVETRRERRRRARAMRRAERRRERIHGPAF